MCITVRAVFVQHFTLHGTCGAAYTKSNPTEFRSSIQFLLIFPPLFQFKIHTFRHTAISKCSSLGHNTKNNFLVKHAQCIAYCIFLPISEHRSGQRCPRGDTSCIRQSCRTQRHGKETPCIIFMTAPNFH